MTNFWEKQIQKAILKQQNRTIHLARCNPDYQRKFPQEHKQNPDCKVLRHCHPEAEKRVIKEQALKTTNSFMPSVSRPPRFNRS